MDDICNYDKSFDSSINKKIDTMQSDNEIDSDSNETELNICEISNCSNSLTADQNNDNINGNEFVENKSNKIHDFITASCINDKESEIFSESSYLLEKIEKITTVLDSELADLEKLKELAKDEGGLINDELRKRAWPLLMEVETVKNDKLLSLTEIKNHKDYSQVVMDVNRSLKRFPPGIDEAYRFVLMDQLTALIIQVLHKNSELHYYQGYHDVAITFLLVLGETLALPLMERLSVTHLRHFMKPTMEKTSYYLTYLYPVLARANEKLYQCLLKSDVGTIFCLPWLITWFAHTLSEYRHVVRLYDFLLASPHLMPMYIAVAIVRHKEEDILAQDCDMAATHFVLSQVPSTLPFESLLKDSSQLYELYPPDELAEEVEDMVKKRNEAEEEQRRSIAARRKGLGSSKGLSVARLGVWLWPEARQRSRMLTGIASVAVVTVMATAATYIYASYTNSDALSAYLPLLPDKLERLFGGWRT